MSSMTGSSASFQDDGTANYTPKEPSAGHAWLIIVGAVAIMWLLGGVVFRRVRM